MQTPTTSTRHPLRAPRSLRLVPELRAVHIERFADQRDSSLLFLEPNFDLGATRLPDGVRRRSFASALATVFFSRAEVLELPEPLWMRFLPKNVALGLAWKVSGAVLGRRRRLVTYAMENNDIGTLLGGRRRLPTWAVSVASRLIGLYTRHAVDRIAFATPAAEAAYRSLPGYRPVSARSVLELPARRAGHGGSAVTEAEVVFAGVLERRKGVDRLLEAWPLVEARVPSARLTLLGPGPLSETVTRWAQDHADSRHYAGHVERDVVLATVARARVVVAPSVPDGRWREQIGLPIKEALAAGATVVTTDQTGLAPWLDSGGHHVVPLSASRQEFVVGLADAIVAALEAPLDPARVRASLPDTDGRLDADRWLHAPESGDKRIAVVNPLGGALDHYTRALVTTLEGTGAQVEVHSLDEPSVSGGSRLHWVRSYMRSLRAARRSVSHGGSGTVLVTWPVLGYLDFVILRALLGVKAVGRIVLHDPKPLVSAIGYSRFSKVLARVVAQRHRLVVHSAVAHEAIDEAAFGRSAAIVPLPVTLRQRSRPSRSGRPVVRVLGQFKPDRDLDALRAIGAALADEVTLEVHGRGWPEIEGWAVRDAFVSEAEFDRLMATSTAIPIPYRRFFQSDIAVRCVELGIPFIGPRESSLAEILPPSSPLLVSTAGADDRERARRWVEAVRSACSGDATDFRRQTANIEQTNRRAWSAWLDDLESA